MTTTIAIVGSRGFTDEALIQRSLERWIVNTAGDLTVVSGGARGADSIGERVARDLGVTTKVHLPQWDRFGKSAGFRRNEDIVRDADVVLAFFAPGPRSKGTSHTVALARAKGKRTFVFHEGAWTAYPLLWERMSVQDAEAADAARRDARGVLDPA